MATKKKGNTNISDLMKATHRGRSTRTGTPKSSSNLTSATLTRITPTPSGPEPNWPAGYSGK